MVAPRWLTRDVNESCVVCSLRCKGDDGFCMKRLERLQTSDGKTTGVTGAAKVLGALMHRAWFGFVCAYCGATKLHKQSVFPKHIRFDLFHKGLETLGTQTRSHGRLWGALCQRMFQKMATGRKSSSGVHIWLIGPSPPVGSDGLRGRGDLRENRP